MEPQEINRAADLRRAALRIKRREDELMAESISPHRRAHIQLLSDRIEAMENALQAQPRHKARCPGAPGTLPLLTSTDEEQLRHIRARCFRKQQGRSPDPQASSPSQVFSAVAAGRKGAKKNADVGNNNNNDDEDYGGDSGAPAKPLDALAEKPWKMPKVDRDLIKDPYLRAQGLHRHNTLLMSTGMRRRLATQQFCAPSVDFNFTGYYS